ncbi:hypothetical protein J4E83_009969 [Alternaria metachromatica]|uniref:uncharacterized protein n=1 Tax=Alternaria metachromatica TaxID=283354 RepID=UPI0020C51658|nr:uncharacterized protein J4E83_009969 [Alternaria metachromatica]KAI4606597.1 hypothetical protein J4E83_009969 [Alternaria metachromatica]
MRSQIACTRCRRSKTKCENTGQGTTCKACANTNRDCTWDHAAVASSTGSVRRDSTADFDAPPKKRRKLLAPTSTTAQRSVEGLGTPEDALQSPLLTSQVWEELFDIYEKHFSTDFPFLHKRTFLSSVRPPPSSGSSSEVKTPTQAPTPRVYAPLLLAFLTQTARFHDKLVAQMGNDPIRTAEFYASATRTQMGTEVVGSPNVEKIQTLLMLGQEGKNPPWCATTGFKKLEDKLKQLKRDLPDHLQLTSDNNDDRSYNSPGKYVAIHAMYTLCFVWLYREYMPTSPWTLTYPRGPLDEPLIDEKPPDPDYWIKQAKDCWKACLDFTTLLHTIENSQVHSNLVQTPTVAFSCFAVGIGTIYCHYFPHMDPDDALSSRKDPRAHDIANGFLLRILSRFKMARSWLSQLAEWQRYYRRERKKYRELSGQIDDSPKSNSSDGVASGGLKDYAQLFERTHKQFGDIANANDNDGQWPDRDKDLADTRLPHDEDSAERTLPTSAASVKHELQGAPEEKSSNQSGFTAVNHNGQQTPPAPPPVTQPSTYAHGGRTPSYDQNSHMRATVQTPYQPYPYPNAPQQQLRSPFQQSDPHQSPVPATANVPIHYTTWPQPRPQEIQEQKVNMEICGAATFPNGWAGDVMIGDSAQDFNNWGQYGFPTIPDNSGYYQSGYSYPPQ